MIIKREKYIDNILDFKDKPVIKVLTGLRRSGKSEILNSLIMELEKMNVLSRNIIYINFESLKYENIKNYKSLYEYIKELIKNEKSKFYIFFDEVQEVECFEKVINSLMVDFDVDIYITGSNANLLSSELSTLLSGRYVEFKINPLSFSEYLDFTKINEEENKLSLEDNFKNYLKFGGLPGIHQMKWDENRIYQYLTDIYNSVLLKDIISRYNIRDTVLLENIIFYLMDNVGNIFSAKTISDFIKNQGRKIGTETIYNYVKYLENTFLFNKVKRYDIRGKQILETQEKYYLTDIGIRNAVFGYNGSDISKLLENVVYNELVRRGYKVFIGKLDTLEVDFIALKQNEKKYVQVCYVLNDENIEREFAPLEKIKDNYEKMIISTDSLINIERNGIKQINIIDFCTLSQKLDQKKS